MSDDDAIYWWEQLERAGVTVTAYLNYNDLDGTIHFRVQARRAPRQRIVYARGATLGQAMRRAANHPLIAPILRGEKKVGA
jgi:hypothetical protein